MVPERPDLAELRQLLDKANPRPWRVVDSDYFQGIVTTTGPSTVVSGRNTWDQNVWPTKYDCDAIVAAVNALPLLLDWIETLEAQLASVRPWLSPWGPKIDALLSPSGSPEPPKP